MEEEHIKEIAKRLSKLKKDKKPCIGGYALARAKKYLDNAAIEVKDGSIWIKKDDSFIKICCYNLPGERHAVYYKNNPNNSFYDGLMLKEKLIEKYAQHIKTTEENGTQIS